MWKTVMNDNTVLQRYVAEKLHKEAQHSLPVPQSVKAPAFITGGGSSWFVITFITQSFTRKTSFSLQLTCDKSVAN